MPYAVAQSSKSLSPERIWNQRANTLTLVGMVAHVWLNLVKFCADA